MGDFLAIQFVKGVGPQLAKRLEKCGVRTSKDFLYFFPRSYDDRRFLPKIKDLTVNNTQLCYGVVYSVLESKTKNRKSIITALIKDQSGQIEAVWFNQSFLLKKLTPGVRVLLKGKIERNSFKGHVQLAVSETEIIRNQDEYQQSVGIVMPIYNLVNGLTQQVVRKISRTVLSQELHKCHDILPDNIKKAMQLMPLQDAITLLHFPKTIDAFKSARYRIVFDEFFLFQITLGLKKVKHKAELRADILRVSGPIISAYLNSLSYTYTEAQSRCIEEIKQDLQKEKPMNRILQGDVGAGKTEVAINTLLCAIESGKKGAIMAPTQILAEQHFYKFQRYLAPLDIPILLVKGKMRKKEKERVLAQLNEEGPLIVVGTHALIEDDIVINGLSVAVIDEQHRFGVMQRMKLYSKGTAPHCLYMTATPIPRSFMLTCFGDLDKSIMDMLPSGRIPPKTYFAKPFHLNKVFNETRKELEKGHQVFVVYPLVEESEKLDLQSAIEAQERIQQDIYPDYVVGLLHGRMSSQEKTEIMDQFKENKIHVLVSTTVIEVGIDIPNATTMIIQHAERFGLSQLHQLRGRIGRSTLESRCYLIAEPKTDTGKKRIQAMVETTDGFKIAEYDLMIRGPGDMLGTRQAGLPDFKCADLIKDEAILLKARKVAFTLLKDDPKLSAREHYWIKKEVLQEHKLFFEKQLN